MKTYFDVNFLIGEWCTVVLLHREFIKHPCIGYCTLCTNHPLRISTFIIWSFERFVQLLKVSISLWRK